MCNYRGSVLGINPMPVLLSAGAICGGAGGCGSLGGAGGSSCGGIGGGGAGAGSNGASNLVGCTDCDTVVDIVGGEEAGHFSDVVNR